MSNKTILKPRLLALGLVMAALAAGPAWSVEYFLRADVTTKTMPDGEVIPVWGYALDDAFGSLSGGEPTVPGPVLTVPEGDDTLIIHLDNNLTSANTGMPDDQFTSLVIPGQATTMVPVRWGATPYPQYQGRIRSTTHETSAGNITAVDYTWTGLKPGSYVYRSGSHIQVQVQMGLYGAMIKHYMPLTPYPGVTAHNEAILLFSALDPLFNQAVATGNYGPNGTVTSAIGSAPQYFLINGEPFSGDPLNPGALPILDHPLEVGEHVLLRFLNASVDTFTPTLSNTYMDIVTEDGNVYPYPRKEYSLMLPAGQTRDGIASFADLGTHPIYDRMLHLTTGGQSGGGLFTQLTVVPPIVPEVVSVVRADPTPTIAPTVDFTVTFSEAVSGVDTSDFAIDAVDLTGAAVSSVTPVSDTVYTVTVTTGSGEGTLSIDVLDDDTIVDVVGNPLAAPYTAGEAYTVLKIPPTVLSVVRVGAAGPTNAASVDFTVTFSEAVSGVDTTDFVVDAAGFTGTSVTSVTPVSTSVYTVTVDTGVGDGTLSIDVLADGTILDVPGNALAGGFTAGEAYTIDTLPPEVVSVTLTNASPTNAALVGFTVTFSEPVSGVDLTDFALDVVGVLGASLQSVTPVSTTVYTVAVNTGRSNNGTLSIDVMDDGTIVDAHGNDLPGRYTEWPAYTITVQADISGDGVLDAVDIQLVINGALGRDTGYNTDVNGDGVTNAVDIQLVINAVLAA